MDLPYNPVIPLPGTHPKKPETLIQQNMCTPVFTGVLFTVTMIWKQPKCPSVDTGMKRLWYSSTVEYHLAVKRRVSYLCDSMDGLGEYYAR